jgi:hypothetical protein
MRATPGTPSRATPDGRADPMALWDFGPAATTGEVSFDLAAAGAFGPAAASKAEPPVIWRLDLPADRGRAGARLDQVEAALAAYERALDAAGSRLDAFILQHGTGTDVSFAGLAIGTEAPPAERELLALFEEAAGPPKPPGTQPNRVEVVSFEAGERALPRWDEVADELTRFATQVQRFLAHYAWVETRLDGMLLARTTVSWTGDVRTTWSQASLAADPGVHRRALVLALRSRATMLRMFLLVVTGAVRIVPLLSVPGGAVLALPAVWRFINQVRAELERQSQLTRED